MDIVSPSNAQVIGDLEQINTEGIDQDIKDLQKARELRDLNRSQEYVYDQMLRGFRYSQIYEVDPDKGPIKSLEKALEIAEENAIIRLA